MKTELTFLSAQDTPLQKVISPTETRSFPNRKLLTSRTDSYTFEVPDEDSLWIYWAAEALTCAAKQGEALLKGRLSRPLVNESRKGMVQKKDPNPWFVLDIDGVKVDGFNGMAGPLNKETIGAAIESIIQMLPSCFSGVSYIYNLSSSMGFKETIHAHLFFRLSQSLAPKTQKANLKALPFSSDELANQCTLTADGFHLKTPIDPVTSENSRLIYIAPPKFVGIPDPLEGIPRIQGVVKARPTINTRDLRTSCAGHEGAYRSLVNRLRADHGLPVTEAITRSVTDSTGNAHQVIENPAQCRFVEHSADEQYIRFNRVGGDSNAYWIFRSDPRIMHSFKGDPSFSYEEADPNGYKATCEKYGLEAEEPPPIVVGFVDQEQGKSWVFSHIRGKIIRRPRIINNAGGLESILRAAGTTPPETGEYPVFDMIFDPDRPAGVDNSTASINLFTPTKLMEDVVHVPQTSINTASQRVRELCPTIHKVLDSMCGNGHKELAYFMNWLAYIYQERDLAGTMWVFHGVEGTGKGVFFGKVLKPIFEDYATIINMDTCRGQYNEWIYETLIYAVDEVTISKKQDRNTFDKLKNMIVEEDIQIRRMYAPPVSTRNRASGILFSNNFDAVTISDHDRRFNVCPRQNTPLLTAYPDLYDTMITGINEDLPKFAGILKTFDVDKKRVRIPLKNAAKMDLRAATMDAFDAFANVIKTGDLLTLINLIDATNDLLNPTSTMEANKIIRDAMSSIDPATGDHRVNNRRVGFYYRPGTFRQLYEAIGGVANNAAHFTNQLLVHDILKSNAPNQVPSLQKYVPPGRNTAQRFRGYRVNWSLAGNTPEEIKELQEEYGV